MAVTIVAIILLILVILSVRKRTELPDELPRPENITPIRRNYEQSSIPVQFEMTTIHMSKNKSYSLTSLKSTDKV